MWARRLLASTALAAVLVASVAIVAGVRDGRRYHVRFASAGLLVKGADVRIGGQRVGSVARVSLTAGEADVEIALERAAPTLRSGTTASLEQPSLAGVANRYVALNPGPNNAAALPDEATIASSHTTSVVELDELYALLDPKTRGALRDVIRGQAAAHLGRGADAARFYATLAPSLRAGDRLAQELAGDGDSLRRFLAASGRLATTLRASTDDLHGAVQESAATTEAFARAAPELRQSLRELPPTLADGERTFAELRSSLDTLQPFIGRAADAAHGVPAFSDSLRATLTDGGGAIDDLGTLLDDPRGRDLTAVLQRLPELTQTALPALRNGQTALDKSRPLVDQFRPYAPDLVGLWGNTALATANYDANGHYARVAPQFGAFREAGGVFEPVAPAERTLAPQTGKLRRCPGGATRPPADGSAPLAEIAGEPALACDPRQTP